MADITAIILAAGKGERIGKPKWQLLYNGKTFLDVIIEKLKSAGIGRILAVFSLESMPEFNPNVQVIVNSFPQNGMFSSLYCGIHNSPPTDGYIIFPVDHPLVATATVSILMQKFTDNKENVVMPSYNQKAGHPLIIPQKLATKVTAADYPGGLKQFLYDEHATIDYVEVSDANVLKNINTFVDLKEIVGC